MQTEGLATTRTCQRRRLRPGALLAGLLVLAMATDVAYCQNREAQGRRAPAAQRRAPAPNAAGGAQQHEPGFVEHLRELPPDQQEKVLENNARFNGLPPERQAQIRENLRRWNQATPEQRQVMRERETILQSMKPEQRQELRQAFQQWQELNPDRRAAVNGAFRQMLAMSPKERKKFLSNSSTKQDFSADERKILDKFKDALPK
ncbi:MAG TPA: DUF3106 domain-containing protein [Terriglobia bacterium]|nr:DUF3106 domain-containing protein [Terriglobia bacterium]